MLKPVTAIDYLGDQLGFRTLVFVNDDPNNPVQNAQIQFPEGRSTLFLDEKIYDWYGREVAIDPQIKHVIRPFGYNISRPHDILNHRDNFLVELTSGKFAVAGLIYRPTEEKIAAYTGSKLRVTGHTLDSMPYLHFDKDSTVFESLDDHLVKNTFLSELQQHEHYPLAAIGHIADSDKSVFVSSNAYSQLHSSASCFRHHIISSKASLIDFFTGSDRKFKKSTHPPTIFCTPVFIGDITVHDDGNKITAYFPYHLGHHYKASLDSDCLAFAQEDALYWYEERD